MNRDLNHRSAHDRDLNYRSAHVLLNLSNELRKRDKMKAC